ncbi:glycosyltransferase [Acinetobacter bereziniae]|uniref:Glycosyl transferase family 1 domain-containing protein n=1 Tax=Acinetobacter bereziniae NIPH 3 TaxID=1217651 RepID=N8YHI7_ACIBZ|nr:glycosyltransferase [Acinetobacter bereziniae]ENV20739.1 hypothetical protein F963_03321 [Acinetobacter bereziniae NIPH 3]MCU4418141.1 glycosyltransferase [Acinetobacter bereziniae]
MKILYIITQLGVGGAESVLVSMADKMVALGHEVEIISLLDINKQNFDSKILVHVLDLKRKPFSSMMKLSSIVGKFQPDVVHSHCLHSNIVARLIRIIVPIKKLVTTAHNTYEGQGLAMSIFKYTNFLSDVITNVSTDAVKAFENKKYVRFSQMLVMHNIIDIHKFEFSLNSRNEYRNMFGINENELALIAVGSMKDSKDYPNLLKAIQLIKEKKLEKFKLFIVGDGQLMNEIQDLASVFELEEYVYFLGNRSDINALLSMADIFILSSKHEGLPTVLVEAAMARNIIITTDCGGIDDILPTRENVVNTGDPIALAEKISEVMQWDNNKSINNINRVYDFVSKNLDPNIVSQQWLRIYSKS